MIAGPAGRAKQGQSSFKRRAMRQINTRRDIAALQDRFCCYAAIYI